MFIQQSNDFIQQIEAEIERLQQLRDQVQTTIQSEDELANAEQLAPKKRAYTRRAGTTAASKKVAAKKRGRPKAESAAE